MRMIVLLVLMLVAIPEVSTQEGRWKKLADKIVAYRGETDRVTLKGNERTANWIRVKCTQGTVQIKEVTIKMEGGKSKTYNPSTGLLTKGMTTVPFQVPGDRNEKVKSVVLKYDTKGSIVTNKRARVEIQGKLD